VDGPSSALLADLILVVHFAFVLFVVGGFALILAGAALGWRWIRNRGFRYAHLATIMFVAAEALVGVACPLTVWEYALRHASPDGSSFVARWVSRLLYYDLPEWVFATAYVLFATAVAVTLWLVPPRSGTRNRLSSSGPSRC
jgi:polyferredoxin